MPLGPPLPAQPATFAALRAMQGLILSECLIGGASPFAALSTGDAARFGVASAVFVGRPKDFKDAYLPQCRLWVAEGSETIAVAGSAGRIYAELEALVQVAVDLRADWYAGEQQILAIRDALLPVLAHHAQLGGSVSTVLASAVRAGRGLCYEEVAGTVYRCYEARWWVRQQWSVSGGRAV